MSEIILQQSKFSSDNPRKTQEEKKKKGQNGAKHLMVKTDQARVDKSGQHHLQQLPLNMTKFKSMKLIHHTNSL